MGSIKVYIPPDFSTMSRGSSKGPTPSFSSGGQITGFINIAFNSNGFTGTGSYGANGIDFTASNAEELLTDWFATLNIAEKIAIINTPSIQGCLR